MDRSLFDSIAGDLAEEARRRGARLRLAGHLWVWRTWLAIGLYFAWHAEVAVLRRLKGAGWRGEWRAAVRSLAKAPTYAVTCISVIALSMGLATTVFAVVDGVLFKRMPFQRPGQLVVISPGHHNLPNRRFDGASASDLSTWRAALPDVPLAGTTEPEGPSNLMPVGPEVNAVQVPTAFVDAEFMHVLGVTPILGGFPSDAFRVTSLDVPRSALLTYALWRTAFGGDPHVVGRVVIVSDQPRLAFEIDGVLPASFVFPSDADAQMLFAAAPGVEPDGFSRRAYAEVIARLPAGESAVVVKERIEAAMAAAPPSPNPMAAAFAGTRFARVFAPYDTATIMPLAQFVNRWQGPMALVVFVAALFLLLLGGVNVSALVAARGEQRTRDLAVRRALGAGTLTIVSFVFAEVAVIVCAGAVTGVLLTRPMLALTLTLLPASVHPLKSVVIDWRVAAFAIVTAAIGALLMTVAPARRALRRAVVLQGDAATVTRRLSRSGRMSIATQVALGMALAVGGALLVGSLVDVWQVRLGFDRHAAAVSLRLRRAPQAGGTEDIRAALERVRHVRGVESAGVMDGMLLQNAQRGGLVQAPPGRPKNDILDVPVTPGFFEVTQPPLLAGRYPTAAELEAGTALAISSSVAAEFWPGAPAVGRTLIAKGATLTVVGVVEDARYVAWDYPEGVIYEPYSTLGQTQTPNLLVRGLHGADPPTADVLAAISSLGPWVQAARVDPLDALLAGTIRDRRFDAWLFGAFAASALVIVLTGLFGLVAMTAAQRTREVGVRMALGATRDRVVGLLVGETAGAVGGGILAGGLVAAWAARYLRASLYEIGVYDARLWFVAVAALLLAAGLGALIPASRASRIDPVQALRVD